MTLKLIEYLYMDNPYLWVQAIFLLTPLPGTELYDLLLKDYNYSPPNSLREWGNYEMPFTSKNYITWHDEKYARLCEELHIWSTFNPFYYLYSKNCHKKNFFQDSRGPYFINRIMGFIQRVRIRHLFFRYPIEHILYMYIFGKRTIYKYKTGILSFKSIKNIVKKIKKMSKN